MADNIKTSKQEEGILKLLTRKIRSMKQYSTSMLLKHETGKYCNENMFKATRPLKHNTEGEKGKPEGKKACKP